jgi:acetyl esterase/lipase
MKRTVTCLGVSLVLGLASLGRTADEPKAEVIDLWPSAPPGESGKVGEETAKRDKQGVVTSITNVTKPTLTVRRPERSKDTGAVVVICPGGGYTNLAWDHEGEKVADWLNSIGVTGVILKYRVPRREGTPKGTPPPQALMDAQRAVGLVRSKAADWGTDPKKVGILGFSAGGHLVAWAGTNYDHRSYEPVDDADKADCRPDFVVSIYPGGVIKRGTTELNPEIKVTSQTPPTFLAVAGNDVGALEGTVALYLALKHADVPAELHVYSTGGHGFGIRAANTNPCGTWPERCTDWMRVQKIIPAAAHP